MRTLLTACFAVLAGLSYLSAHADTVIPSERVVNFVTVRADPGGGATVGQLRPGDSAELVDDAAGYHGIELGNGVRGWVSKSWTTVIETVAEPGGQLAIHFIDVGQGDSTLIVCPNGNRILVDVGSVGGGNPDAIRDYILARLGPANRIHDLVITHPDRDHYNLIETTLAGVTVEHTTWIGEMAEYGQADFDDWLGAVPADRRTNLDVGDFDPMDSPNTQLDCGGADVFVLSAEETSGPASWRRNTMSIVLMVRFGEFEAVLTGDATTATEAAILARYPTDWLDVDVLKIGHHGSSTTSTSAAWANALQPQIAVSSAGHMSQFGHPRQVVVNRLDDHTIAVDPHPFSASTGSRPNYTWSDLEDYDEGVYSTSMSGNVTVTTDGVGALRVGTGFHPE